MLIKSQDGKMLVMFTHDSLTIIEWGGRTPDIHYQIHFKAKVLGSYSTEAQAKEVLEEIAIEYGEYYKNAHNEVSNIPPKVYIMPQDKGADYGNQ